MKLPKRLVITVFSIATLTISHKVMERYDLLNVRKYMDYGRHALYPCSSQITSEKLQSKNYSLIPKVCCPEDTHIVVVAISHIDEQATRNELRRCWRGEHRSNDCYWIMCPHNTACDLSNLQLVFMVGKSSTGNITMQKMLEEEHFEYDDIIQGTFNDTYRNLVHKSILLLDYAVNYCRSAKFVQKIDSNVYLDMPAVKRILRKYPDTPEGYAIGHKVSGYKVKRAGKWKLSKTELSSDYYPDYLHGASYIISKNARTVLLNVARKQPMKHVEDVFMGLCIKQTNIKLIHRSAFCDLKRWRKCAIIHHR